MEKFKKFKRSVSGGYTLNIACYTQYGYVIHATHTDSQRFKYYDEVVTDEPITDLELLKLWNHSTIERKYGPYATQPGLKRELESRGYILIGKHKWSKNNVAENQTVIEI